MNPTLAMFIFTLKDIFNVIGAVIIILFFGISILAARIEEKEKEKNRRSAEKTEESKNKEETCQ